MRVCVMGNLCRTDTVVDVAADGALAVEQAVAADGGAAGESCRIEWPSRRHRRR